MNKFSNTMKAILEWLKKNPWKAAEAVSRFAPLVSVSIYIGVRARYQPEVFDAYIVMALTVVTLGIWAFTESMYKRFG